VRGVCIKIAQLSFVSLKCIIQGRPIVFHATNMMMMLDLAMLTPTSGQELEVWPIELPFLPLPD
jgi:hypothetical protein